MQTLESSVLAPHQFLKWLFTGLIIAALLAGSFLIASLTGDKRPGTLIIKASGLHFSETEIHAKVGQTVNLELFNTDGYAHAFDVDEFNVHVQLPGSQTTSLTFTPTQPGTFTFYCGAYGHETAGMVGTLIVEP